MDAARVRVQAPPAGRRRLVLLLGSLSATAALSIDMYLPAMPGMARQLDTDASLVQLSLTVFVVGLALGQVLVGPVSDAFGRRRPLLAGLAAYVAGSLVCLLAPDVGVLIGGRVVQALGAAAATVLSRAIVRDLFGGTEMTRFFSTLMLVNGVAPVLAPVLGGQVLAFADWRAVFAVLLLAGVVLLAVTWLGLPESLPVARRRPARPADQVRTFARLARDGEYVRYVVAAGLMFACVFAYISGSSFVLQEVYGLSAQQFSLVFGLNGVGILLAGQLNGRLVGRVAGERTLLGAGLVVAVAASGVVLAATVTRAPLPVLLAGLFCCVSMLGLVLADATSLALARHGDDAGAASSGQGLVQFLLGGLAVAVMGAGGQGSALPMAATMTGCAVAALAVFGARCVRSGTRTR